MEVNRGLSDWIWNHWHINDMQKAQILPRLRGMEETIAQLEEIKAAAQIIYDVSSKASLKADAIECPHGNIPSYPSHAWWCDKCFYRLEDALEGKS